MGFHQTAFIGRRKTSAYNKNLNAPALLLSYASSYSLVAQQPAFTR